jgi:uncharacterized membrane protein
MMRTFRISSWLLMLLLASVIALISLRYFFLSPEVAAGPPLGEKFAEHFVVFITHVAGGTLALFLGPWQFWGGLRKRFLSLHRWLGRLYLCGILAGGIAGLYLAVNAFGGLPTRTGFGGLAALWLVTGYLAYVRIRQGDVRGHREWMIRNYALTFAAVTLRLWLPLLMTLGFNFTEAYMAVAWLCWVPNLAIVELYLKGVEMRRNRRLKRPAPANEYAV